MARRPRSAIEILEYQFLPVNKDEYPGATVEEGGKWWSQDDHALMYEMLFEETQDYLDYLKEAICEELNTFENWEELERILVKVRGDYDV